MITNGSESAVAEALDRCREEIASAGALLDALERHDAPFRYAPGGAGFEFAAEKPVEGRPNRAVIDVCMSGPCVTKISLSATGAVVMRGEFQLHRETAVAFR